MKSFSNAQGVGLFLLIVIICVSCAGSVFADNRYPQWVGDVDSATVTHDTSIETLKSCTHKQVSVVVMNRELSEPPSRETTACVYNGEDIEVADFYALNGQVGVAIKRKGDTAFRHLINKEHSYSEKSDTLVYQTDPGTKLMVVKSLRDNVILGEDNNREQTKYVIRGGAEESLLSRGSDSHAFYEVTHHTLSANGRYVAAYVGYEGVVRIDLETGERTSVFRQKGSWLSGPRNIYPAAISDDGKYILLGPNFKMIDVYDCGEAFAGSFNPDGDWCIAQDYSQRIFGLLGYSYTIPAARFIANSYGIEINTELIRGGTVYYGDGLPKHVTVTVAGGQQMPRLKYLAMGDSYSSGEGDIEGNGQWYKSGTEKERGCHLSTRSYPYLLGEAWAIETSNMASVACSGALIGLDFAAKETTYNGQDGELSRLSDQKRGEVVRSAIENYKPGIVPQLEFVKKYRPKVVTITGAGNDVGFAEIIQYCAGDFFEALAFNYSCEYIKGGALEQLLNDAIDTQYAKVQDLINEIKQASPGVKVFYVGYPSFIGGSDTFCMFNSGVLDKKERDMINNAVTRLNTVIRKAAASSGVQYVDIESALHGGRLCEGSEYMTGILDAGLIDVLTGKGQNAFHPNAKGHQKIEESIISAVPNPLEHYSPSEPDVVAIEPGVPTSRARIVRDPQLNNEERLEIELEPDTAPGSSDVFIAAFSTPTNLGNYKTKEDGSLNAQIQLPTSLKPGMHLLLLGIWVDGALVERKFDYFFRVDDSNKETSVVSKVPQIFGVSEPGAGNELLRRNSSGVLPKDPEQGVASAKSTMTNPTPGSVANDSSSRANNALSLSVLCILLVGLIWGLYKYAKKNKE